jgi:hypothetical protein
MDPAAQQTQAALVADPFAASSTAPDAAVMKAARAALDALWPQLVDACANEEDDPDRADDLVGRYVESYGSAGLRTIDIAIMAGAADPPASFELLRRLGSVRPTCPDVRSEQASLLARSLGYRSPMVREGAALAIAKLGDQRLLSAIQVARQRERHPATLCVLAAVEDRLASRGISS